MSSRWGAAARQELWQTPPFDDCEAWLQGFEPPHGQAGAARAETDKLPLCLDGEGGEDVCKKASYGAVARIPVLEFECLKKPRG
eukprot:CAMPEP_0173408390 /NCGR_PEP_ID=MMETSP1356-20130122/69615_1 /TAXON_ID=77927 ORGANISM="Hemiselmis virescens, Strain PCC157" /NCGR_SAMPLE_ID=MMETSP1356 /ASSEMBLY_ACC=CAM_ASM_000847 /LENGTH=83 /DNA_ID=CAMNT_0014369693 /DNA_START=241 /DNA_END=493 /DNA_ORIENTATION=-